MSKLPAIQFYPGDWRKDPGVQSLSYEERGIWLELLFLMHESESPGKLMIGGQPYPIDRLARLLGLSAGYLEVIITSLITLGVASTCEETGALMNRRMVRDRALHATRAESGKKGGNPNFQKGKSNPYYDKQKDNQGDNQKDKQKITPSSSSSSSTSDDISKHESGGDGLKEGNPEPDSQKPQGRKYKAKGTLQEVIEYCTSRNLPESDGQWFFDKAEGCGWKNGGKAIVDWQATVRAWSASKYFPSQKTSFGTKPRNQAYDPNTATSGKNVEQVLNF